MSFIIYLQWALFILVSTAAPGSGLLNSNVKLWVICFLSNLSSELSCQESILCSNNDSCIVKPFSKLGCQGLPKKVQRSCSEFFFFFKPALCCGWCLLLMCLLLLVLETLAPLVNSAFSSIFLLVPILLKVEFYDSVILSLWFSAPKNKFEI